MNKIEDILTAAKLNEILGKKEEPKKSNTLLWVLAVIGAVAAVAAIAYAVYKYLTPDYLEDFEDDFDDDFDDDFFEDEEPETVTQEPAATEE
ncbi:MAG: DUF4366 domain-containing protein [Lachnospiraceae bacterium]|nr:DUF4366 domain-containing protein [Lachnospiraceae bacterium]